MKVVFERIGRTGSTPTNKLTLDLGPCKTAREHEEAEIVMYRHVGNNLASSDYTLTVDWDAGDVFIAGGRFGTGQLVDEG